MSSICCPWTYSNNDKFRKFSFLYLICNCTVVVCLYFERGRLWPQNLTTKYGWLKFYCTIDNWTLIMVHVIVKDNGRLQAPINLISNIATSNPAVWYLLLEGYNSLTFSTFRNTQHKSTPFSAGFFGNLKCFVASVTRHQ